MESLNIDTILCPGDRPHRKKARDKKGAVEVSQCDRTLMFSHVDNVIEEVIVPCPGCGSLISISQSPENGVSMIVKEKTQLNALNTLKVVSDDVKR